MRTNNTRFIELTVAALILSAPTSLALAQDGATVAPLSEVVRTSAPIQGVTLYQGRALISRAATAPTREGLFEIRFENLPSSLESDSLQATIAAPQGGAKLLDVRYEEIVTPTNVSNNPHLREAITALDAAKRDSERMAMQMTLINDQYALFNSIAQKTATESAKDFGSKSLDPQALAAQVAFLAKARNDLIDARMQLDAQMRANTLTLAALQDKVSALGGQSTCERTAIVTVGKSSIAAAEVTLRYLVRDASWAPRYAIRADIEGNELTIEYDAQIRQATGEDWSSVMLTLSSAQPTQRAAPYEVTPVYLDVFVAPPTGGMTMESGFAGVDKSDTAAYFRHAAEPASAGEKMLGITGKPGGYGDPAEMPASAPVENAAYKALYDDASATRSGTVVLFPIPRATSVPSDGTRTQKLRIATIVTKPAFTYVARPLVESAVYLKAVAANTSNYQLLAGDATVFLGGDSVGSTQLPDLAAGSEMTFWLGTDRRLDAKRVLVKKETVQQGVFSKTDLTRWDYRIDLTSTDDRAVSIEVVDRMPVSRNEQIKVDLHNDLKAGGVALATDAKYLADEKPQGILKWVVELPAAHEAGKPATRSILWSVLVSTAKDVATTGAPD